MDPFEQAAIRRRQCACMTNAMPHPAPPRNLARISPTDFAGLFSGEDALGTPARRHRGLLRATADLLADSVRTAVDSSEMRARSSEMRARSQVFAKRAT